MINRFRCLGEFLALSIALLWGSHQPLIAATKAEKQRAARELVNEALSREVYGMSGERDELLKKAADQVSDYAPAMWQRGYLRHKSEWIKADNFDPFKNDSRVATYRRIRGDHEQTAESQMELANWCGSRGLTDQERAHLTQVVELQPNHAEARGRLGFRWIDDAWVHVNDVEATIRTLQSDRQHLAKWSPTVQQILKSLKVESQSKRQHAREQLSRITDPGAVLALENILSSESESIAMLVLATLENIPTAAATMSLARHAVFAPWPRVRERAGELLCDRTKDEFVPALLAEMYSPIQTRMELYRGPGGRMVYRHSFAREGQSEKQMLVLETAYRRVAQPGGDRNESLGRALTSAQLNASEAEWNVATENLRSDELNQRIAKVLSTVSRETLPYSPEYWWSWWTDYNELFVPGPKPTRTIEQRREVAIVDQVQPRQEDETTSDGPTNSATGGTRGNIGSVSADQLPRWGAGRGSEFNGFRMNAYDCLVAGTTVWTSTGPVPIEQVQIGDVVLSKNIESGELAYQPVLGKTVRPECDLLKILIGEETVEASGGHPFWISGEGWIKARDLRPGMQLHSVDGSLPVRSVELSRKEKTYNLIVADFHTYFVGDMRILSHDNTIRALTECVVPGMIDESNAFRN